VGLGTLLTLELPEMTTVRSYYPGQACSCRRLRVVDGLKEHLVSWNVPETIKLTMRHQLELKQEPGLIRTRFRETTCVVRTRRGEGVSCSGHAEPAT
jgi:hypothetical protein